MTPLLARILPFCLYMAFVAVPEIGTRSGLFEVSAHTAAALYPVKIGLVGLALVLLWKRYDELSWADLGRMKDTTLSLVFGAVLFVLWINLDMPFAVTGDPQGFDPSGFGGLRLPMIAVRLFGAAIIVPIMEELFWRSFLARYLVDKNFTAVRHGTFTVFTFTATAILFGLEHNLWLAGILAGVAYNYIYMRTGSVVQCILSHGVTNLLLGVYVIATGHWLFW
ncbi:CAAX prenyl protease-related protein [Pseudodesulfovibrio mercurii]|uniref:CAAX prenyl protease-related protein n=1 Tax=Pseudodesulfovibrio mercurii TaxID=641491 RepID=F0JCC6_9BACT|nr:CAAX prenyl protease-related protein [Pseudodesulfovibrio mercurii]EGB14424.1 CAAX prenyl protease-related protein [Pseudodesulfovibrio mercurii]